MRNGPCAVSTYDALLRAPGFAASHRPDLILQLGAPLTGRVATTWLGRAAKVLVDPDGSWLDPTRSATERLASDPSRLLAAALDALPARPDGRWLGGWLEAEAVARQTVDDLVDSWDELFEGRVARDLVGCLPDRTTLVVGSSMPVRDVEGFARPRAGVRFLGNRGASGIDGFNATLLGVAAATPGPVAGLAGDLTFLHDAGGLLGASKRGLDAVLVVIDNDGGGVFSFLPQAESPELFENVFGTPHGIDLAAVAAAYDVAVRGVGKASEVVPAVHEALAAGGLQVVVVPTDRARNVALHLQVWEAVAAAVAR